MIKVNGLYSYRCYSLLCTHVPQELVYVVDLKCCVSGVASAERRGVPGLRPLPWQTLASFWWPRRHHETRSLRLHGEGTSSRLAIFSMSQRKPASKPSASVGVQRVLLLRIKLGGSFSGLGPWATLPQVATVLLGTVRRISTDSRNMKVPASCFLCWVLFLLVHKKPVRKVGCNNFAPPPFIAANNLKPLILLHWILL